MAHLEIHNAPIPPPPPRREFVLTLDETEVRILKTLLLRTEWSRYTEEFNSLFRELCSAQVHSLPTERIPGGANVVRFV